MRAWAGCTPTVSLVRRLEPAIYAGGHMRGSRGNIHFARFGDGNSSEGKAALAVPDPRLNGRIGARPTTLIPAAPGSGRSSEEEVRLMQGGGITEANERDAVVGVE